ncbi:hypothetical protein ABZ619_14545 [Streptomyces sp. NPDC007851]|uniref:hypothetical protein n=1 Tax=Streptomyces sp. NPDC007851 TaxID=3155008 RepID=UPI0033FB60D3
MPSPGWARSRVSSPPNRPLPQATWQDSPEARQGLGRVESARGSTAAALRRFTQARTIAEEAHDEVLAGELDSDVAATEA